MFSSGRRNGGTDVWIKPKANSAAEKEWSDSFCFTRFNFLSVCSEECVCPWASWTGSPGPSSQQGVSRREAPGITFGIHASPQGPRKGWAFQHTLKVNRSRQSSKPRGPVREGLESSSVLQILDLETFSDKLHLCIVICTYRNPKIMKFCKEELPSRVILPSKSTGTFKSFAQT